MKILLIVGLVIFGIVAVFNYATTWFLIIGELFSCQCAEHLTRKEKVGIILANLVLPLWSSILFFRHPIRNMKRSYSILVKNEIPEDELPIDWNKLNTILDTIDNPPKDNDKLKEVVLSFEITSSEFKGIIKGWEKEKNPNAIRILKILEEFEENVS